MVDIRAINGISRPNTAVIFGDSITANNTAVTSTNARFKANGYFTVANIIMGSPLTLLNNAGVSGNTTTQMLARIASDVLSFRPGYCFYEGGRNDASGLGASFGSTVIANDASMFALLKAAGIFTFVLGLIPSSDLTGNDYRNGFAAINRARKVFCETSAGFVYIDTARALSDPATGQTYSGMFTDGLHPSQKGAMYLGRAIAETVQPIIAGMPTGVSNALDWTNYVQNPFANGSNASGTNGFTASTVTGVGPNGWYTRARNTGAAVSSKITRSNTWKLDSMAQLAITCSADYDGAAYYVGGSDANSTGKYDVAWAATTAYTYNSRVKPTVANGFTYVVAPGGAGTSSSSQPTWPTSEGAKVTDGTVTWFCQKMPVAGDQFFAECELQLSGLTGGWAVPMMELDFIDTANVTQALAASNYADTTGSSGAGFDFLPATVKLRTPIMTMPSMTLRYLRASIWGYGGAGASFNMAVGAAAIRRYST